MTMRYPVMNLATAALLAWTSADLAAQETAPRPDPLQQSAARLHKSLQTMATLPAVNFTATWGPDKPAKGDSPIAVFLANGASASTGTLRGTATAEVLHLAWEDGNEYLQAGRQTLAKDANSPWTPRRDKFADGVALGFVPDPTLLFRTLQHWELPVLHRTVDTLQDRPVEILTCTLDADQVVTALYSGLLPAGGAGGFTGQIAFRAAAGGAGRMVPSKPEATIDVAFFVDPATGHLHKMHVRMWQKSNVRMGAAGIVVVAGGAARPAEAADEEEDDKTDPSAPPRYEQGLPVRPRKQVQVTDFVLTLQDFGTATPPELDQRARTLLGR